jgi:hypothetical protein
MNILGTRLDTDKDHRLAHFIEPLCGIRVEYDLTRRSARRCRQTFGQHIARRGGIKRRTQQQVQCRGIDAGDRLFGTR